MEARHVRFRSEREVVLVFNRTSGEARMMISSRISEGRSSKDVVAGAMVVVFF